MCVYNMRNFFFISCKIVASSLPRILANASGRNYKTTLMTKVKGCMFLKVTTIKII